MKNVIILLFLLLPFIGKSQTQAWVETTSKAGKVTIKEIVAHVDSLYIYFEVSGTSHFAIGRRKSGEWAQIKDNAYGNVCEVYSSEGYLVFQVSKTKRFYFKK